MHLKIFSSQMITPIGPKMSTAIEELIHTIATLRTRMKSFPEWYIYLAGHICHVMHVSHDVGTRQLCCSVQTGLKPMQVTQFKAPA